MSGLEFDRSLRAGQPGDGGSLPRLGRLLAATQTGGPERISVNTDGIAGSIAAIMRCSGEADTGPRVAVTSGSRRLLRFRTDGCNATLLYSAASEPIGDVAEAEMTVTIPAGIDYSLVLEQVA